MSVASAEDRESPNVANRMKNQAAHMQQTKDLQNKLQAAEESLAEQRREHEG